MHALADRKEANLRRVASGKRPIVAGKEVSARKIGMSKSKAQRILKNR